MGVSTLEPRKNFPGLIQAFNAVRFREAMKRDASRSETADRGRARLEVASRFWHSMREFVGAGDVIHLEKVTAEELRVLYTHAEAFVFPSHAEGFGFPPVEAMQCDVPVIASDLAEHRWVMGDAALYCNSYDVTSIADAIERLLASEESTGLAGATGRPRTRTRRALLARPVPRAMVGFARAVAGVGRAAAAHRTAATTRI